CSINEFGYLVEAHHHLNPIFISKYDSPRRIDDSIVMLVLETRGIPLRFGELQLSLMEVEVVVVVALGMIRKLQELLKVEMVPLVEEEGVADEMETNVAF
nr:hypothetical protein [Tanacetum cinerariifolium]